MIWYKLPRVRELGRPRQRWAPQPHRTCPRNYNRKALHGSTGDSSSKDTGDSSSKDSSEEEMESFDTLTHIVFPSDNDLREYAEALLSSEASYSNSMDVS